MSMLKDLRVLFVDDDQPVREVVYEVLQHVGARVELAASAAEGLEALETFKPHVILCDITMPIEDGYSFIRRVRKREASAGPPRSMIPAMALSVHATVNDRRRSFAAGFQAHVAKPIDIAGLRSAVLELSMLEV